MTPNWDILLNEASLASVLPAEYAHFARPIRDGLTVFLCGLPEEDQSTILKAQATLPFTATIFQRLGLLARSSPVLQKLGQILARDRRLAAELRMHLRELESLPPTVPLETIEQILRSELGDLEWRGITLAPPAVAEASVAVVIPYCSRTRRRSRTTSGTPTLVTRSPRSLATSARVEVEGVFKVLKPGIEERLDRELVLLGQVGEHLDQRCEELDIPRLDFQEAFQQVRDKLWDEVDLRMEQRHLAEAHSFFADEPRVRIPRLLDHCTPRVTAMEWISGGKVTGHDYQCGRVKRRLAALVARALVAKPIFARGDQAFFHGDPHAGNLFLTEDGHLAILDWSLVGRLGERERVAIVQVMLAAITLDAARMVSVLEELADERLDVAALKTVVESWVRQIRRGHLPGLTWLVGMLDDATQNARLRVSADLMLFRKSLHTLEGVVADVGESTGQIDNVLSLEFLRHFAAEWPGRWLRLPHSRDFATRLSNFDLTRTMLSYPATASRFWTGHAIDILDAMRNLQKTW